MNVSLGVQWEQFVNEKVESGRYLTASEVVRDGLCFHTLLFSKNYFLTTSSAT